MEFQKYQHIERLGTEEVENIELGTCYVFPKIDGTCSEIWLDDNGEIQTGSRNRHLSEGQNDNAGFREAVKTETQFDGIKKFLKEYPEHRLYGEWLVPHTLKTYRSDAWKKFYVFDITILNSGNYENYLSYDVYKQICDLYIINYIPCIKIIKNGVYEDFIHMLENNNYLIEDGKGIGEGIVIKNYNYRNKYGRITWAKIVTSEFKEKHIKEMGSSSLENKLIEDEITNNFCNLTLIDKTYAKIAVDGWFSKYIPRLLETVYHDLVTEDIYNILKKYNSPIINFKTLRHFVIQKIKELKPELF